MSLLIVIYSIHFNPPVPFRPEDSFLFSVHHNLNIFYNYSFSGQYIMIAVIIVLLEIKQALDLASYSRRCIHHD